MWEAVLWPLAVVLVVAALFVLSIYLVGLGARERENEWRWDEVGERQARTTPDTPHAA